jgi:hypothetical protein
LRASGNKRHRGQWATVLLDANSEGLMVTKTVKEIEEMRILVERGELPPDAIEKHYEAEAKNVFGHDAKKVKGEYVEQGIGSPGNQTANSIAAYKKYCNPANPKASDPDPNFTENLARMEKELADSNKKRAKKAAA